MGIKLLLEISSGIRILLISLIVVLWNMTFTDVGDIFGQQEIDTDGYYPNGSIESITLITKFCPPGYIVDKSGYCDSETKSIVPGLTSSIGSENITTKETESWPASNNAFFTNKQLMSMGKTVYRVYENELYDFEIEYPEGSAPSEYGGGITDFYFGGDAVVSIYVYDRSDPNNSFALEDYLDESIDSFESSSDYLDFKLTSSQVDMKLLGGYPSYSLAGTYNQGLGLVNETGAIIDDMIYSIQYYGNDVTEYLPVIEHMIRSFKILDSSFNS